MMDCFRNLKSASVWFAFWAVMISQSLVAATVTSTQTGNWGDGSTWVGGTKPSSGDDVVIAAGHTVTLNEDATVSSLTINGTGTFTEDGGGRRLSVQASGTITNNGSWTASAEIIDYEGAGTIDGSSATTFFDLEVNGGLTITTAPTINGTLEIKSGGSVSAAVNYGTSSTLKYNSGGTYNRWKEWDDTDSTNPGFPHHLVISGNTTLNVKNGTNADRFTGGDITIESGSTMSMQDNNGKLSVGGDFTIQGTFTQSTVAYADTYIFGDYTNSGTYTPNDRSLVFSGTQDPQLLTETTGSEWDYFSSHKTSGYVKLMTNLTIKSNKWLTLHNGGGLDLNDKTVTIKSNGQINCEYDGTSNIINSGVGTGTIEFEGSGTINADGAEVVTFGTGVKIMANDGLSGLGAATINGEIEFGGGNGYPNGEGPIWGANSLCVIDRGTDCNYSSNWNNLWNNTMYNWTIASGTTFRLDSDGTISSSGTVTVNGSIIVHDGSANRDMDFTHLVIGASGTINMNNTVGADLFVSGDFTVTSGGTMQTDDRLIEFDGNGTQTISGDFGAQKLDYVNINNSHATQGVELECDITIDHQLRLLDGYLFTKDNYLTFDGTASYCDAANDCNNGDGDSDSHIVCDGDGGVKLEDYAGSDVWTFPVASAPGEYDQGKGVKVDDQNDNISSGTLTCGLNSDLTMNGDDDEILNPTEFVQTLYYLSHTAGVGDGVQITLYWHTSDEGGAFSRASAEMYHLDGSDDWQDENASTSGSGSHYYVQKEVSSFSPFAIGDEAPAILPVDLIAYDVFYSEEDQPELIWRTASELNNDYFEIWWSADGANYDLVGTILGNGTVSDESQYSFEPSESQGYFKLIQVDFDGTKTDHGSVFVTHPKSKRTMIYPNPVMRGGQVQIQGLNYTAVVMDAIGREVLQLPKGQASFTTSALATGLYFIRGNGLSAPIKLIVE